MNKNDWNKLVKYSIIGLLAVCLTFWVVIPAVEIIGINVLDFLIDYINEHLMGVFIVCCVFGCIIYCMCQVPVQKPTDTDQDPMPTMRDYKNLYS